MKKQQKLHCYITASNPIHFNDKESTFRHQNVVKDVQSNCTTRADADNEEKIIPPQLCDTTVTDLPVVGLDKLIRPMTGR